MLARVPYSFRGRYLPFQEECLMKLFRNKHFMVNLSVGSGKTLIALSLYHFLRERNSDYKCLYITEHAVVRQVGEALDKFFDSGLEVVTLYRDDIRGRIFKYRQFADNGDILVISYDNLVGAFGRKVAENRRALVEEEAELLSGIIDSHAKHLLVVADEATNIKNGESLANRILVKISGNVSRVVAMTGTPIMKNLLDVYNIARGVGVPLMPLWAFERDYCTFSSIYVRGRKVRKLSGHKSVGQFWDVWKNFFYSYKVESGLGLRWMRYDLELGALERSALQDIYEAYSNNPVFSTCAIAVSYPAGKGGVKFGWFKEFAEKVDDKIVVYSPFLTVIKGFIDGLCLSEGAYAAITGEVSDKAGSKERFIRDGKCRFLFITDAGAKGLDGLQKVARHIVFLNLPVSSGQLVQVIGRLYRLGSEYSDVVVHVPVVWGSIDEDVYRLVQSELRLVESVNPEQLIGGLVDRSVKLDIKYDEVGDIELWLKERIKERKY